MKKNVKIVGNFKQTYHIFLKGKSKLFILPSAFVNRKSTNFLVRQELLVFSLFENVTYNFRRSLALINKRRLTFRLYSNDYAYLSAKELEAVRRSIRRLSKKALKKKLFIPASPYLYLTKKPNEVRMGKGKGTKIRDHVCPCRPGKVIVELRQVSKRLATFALSVAQQKLSVFSSIVKKPFYARHRRLRYYRGYSINIL